MTRGIFFAATLLLFAGCTHTQSVNPGIADRAGLSELNATAMGRGAKIIMTNGETFGGVSVRVAFDSTSWIDPKINTYQVVPTSDIESITVIRSGKGALAGVGLGIMVGAVAGTVRAYVEGDDPAGTPLSLSQKKKHFIYPVAHAVYAMLVSAPVGAIIGDKATYRFSPGAGIPSASAEPVVEP